MIEYDGVEIAAVVVLNEILGGVGDLQTPSPETLLLKQRLIQGKNHLQQTSRANKLAPERAIDLQYVGGDSIIRVPFMSHISNNQIYSTSP